MNAKKRARMDEPVEIVRDEPVIHEVVKGDTLSAIAGKYLGDASRASEIRRLNDLATDILRIGRKLIIPKR